MRIVICLLFFGISAGTQAVNAQGPPAAARDGQERVLAIVPMVGAGTYSDPRRPMFAPAPVKPRTRSVVERKTPEELYAGAGAEITGYRFVAESDDGKHALVEFSARDYRAFGPLLEERQRRPEMRVFRRGFAKRAGIEEAFRRHRKGFRLESFGEVRP